MNTYLIDRIRAINILGLCNVIELNQNTSDVIIERYQRTFEFDDKKVQSWLEYTPIYKLHLGKWLIIDRDKSMKCFLGQFQLCRMLHIERRK